MKAKLIANRNYIIGEISPKLYGSFIEHLGRTVYRGIYERPSEATTKLSQGCSAL